MPKLISLVVGARPNFVKAFSLVKEARNRNIPVRLIHTGQHYDYNMSEIFLREFGLAPDVYICKEKLGRAEFLAACFLGLMRDYEQNKPRLVISVGDTNSSLLAALSASKLNIPVAHVEAGLRSFDDMEEETNRRIIDHISTFLFVTEQNGVDNLYNEGVRKNVFLVGNTMIDTLMNFMPADTKKENFALLTLHRQYNVENFSTLLPYIDLLSERYPIVKFPVHPRTQRVLPKLPQNIELMDPLGYTEFIRCLSAANLVVTDSGGVQEESSILNTPCFTLRKSTERPITCSLGTNRLITSVEEFAAGVKELRSKRVNIPLWDGFASKRIFDILESKCAV